MTLLFLAALAVLALATYLSALSLALLRVRRTPLERRFEEDGRPEAAGWLIDRRNALMFNVAFFRTAARITFFILVFAETVDLSGGAEAALAWPSLVISGLIATVLLWIVSIVLSNAIAQHAGVGLIVGSLPFLRVLNALGSPLLRPFTFIDEAVRRLAGAAPADEVAEQELLRSIEETQREGALDAGAATILENVVEFTDTDVAEIMTPRTDIMGLEYTDDLYAIRGFIAQMGHSRIPVYRENLDNIVGILYVKDLIPYLGEDAPDFRLGPVLRQPLMVPETKSVPELLADFQNAGVHLAIVVDEYGGTEGLVTIEDVLEEIVGDIHDEHDTEEDEEPVCVEIDDHHAEVDGRFYIDDLNERLGLELPEDEDYDTIAGFVLAKLGRIPLEGDSFEFESARFTATAVTPTQVQKVAVELLDRPIRPATENGAVEANGAASHEPSSTAPEGK